MTRCFRPWARSSRGIVPGEEVGLLRSRLWQAGRADLLRPEFQGSERAAGGGLSLTWWCFRRCIGAACKLRRLAFELGAFVVTSISNELGVVIDRCGRVLKESTYESLAVALINTNSVALHMDFNWDKMDQMLEKHGREAHV